MRRSMLIFPLITVLLLGGMAVHRMSYYAMAGDADPYHAHVREAIDRVPYKIGQWQGQDIEVPAAATALLRPNAILSRQYVHQETGQKMGLLIVHCRDARDMLGHYPPVCYPSNGWTEDHAGSCQVEAGETTLTFAEYGFSRLSTGRPIGVTIFNLIMLPDGQLAQSMEAVQKRASDYRAHFFGAGQIQLRFAAGQPAHVYQAITEQFTLALAPVIQAIASGGDYE